MVLWLAVLKLFSFVVVWSYGVEVSLHEVYVVTIVFIIDSWISNDDDTVLME